MLQGIRVVELGVWVAGPAAAGILADWGADVIKVEPPAGDPMRAIFQTTIASEVPHNPPFELDNRGKRSVVLDLGSEAGRRAMEALLAGADVLVTNMRPAALERLGLEFRLRGMEVSSSKGLRREDDIVIIAARAK